MLCANCLKKPLTELADVFVIHDDIELALGRLKLRLGGSNAGHNGLQSISEKVGNEYLRFRLGIGRPEASHQVADYVLKPFEDAEEELAQALTQWATDAVEEVLAVGLTKAQNRIHRQDFPEGFSSTDAN